MKLSIDEARAPARPRADPVDRREAQHDADPGQRAARGERQGRERALELAATDLEVGIRSSQPAKVAKPGALTVSARKLYEIVRELPDETVHLEATSNAYLDAALRARASSRSRAPPRRSTRACPSFAPGKIVRLQAAGALRDDRAHDVRRVDRRDPLQPERRLRRVDRRHRQAPHGRHRRSPARATSIARSATAFAALASGVIIPRKGLAELKRLVDEEDADEVELGFEGNSGLARKGGVTLTMRLIEGEFPNYRQVIPTRARSAAHAADRAARARAAPRRAALRRAQPRGEARALRRPAAALVEQPRSRRRARGARRRLRGRDHEHRASTRAT